MSKMDGLRAMREARYERATARTSTPAGATKTPTRSADRRRPAAEPPAAPEPGEQQRETAQQPETAQQLETALCGHRAISGRTCTREHGHAAKSHRYS